MVAETSETRKGIRRILVALDASRDSVAALEASAWIAAAKGAELIGIFVEDQNLLELARLPFAREIDFFSAEARNIDAPDIEPQLRRQAKRARRILRRVAESRGVRWSFRTVRGRVAYELLTRSAEADLISLGATSRSLIRGPGSTVRTLLAEASGPVMVLRRGARITGAIHLLYDGSKAADRALAAAAELLEGGDGHLTVLVLANGDPEGMQKDVEIRLRERDIAARFVRVARVDREASRLSRLLSREGCGLIVTPASLLTPRHDALRRLLSRVGCPVLLVGE